MNEVEDKSILSSGVVFDSFESSREPLLQALTLEPETLEAVAKVNLTSALLLRNPFNLLRTPERFSLSVSGGDLTSTEAETASLDAFCEQACLSMVSDVLVC